MEKTPTLNVYFSTPAIFSIKKNQFSDSQKTVVIEKCIIIEFKHFSILQ